MFKIHWNICFQCQFKNATIWKAQFALRAYTSQSQTTAKGWLRFYVLSKSPPPCSFPLLLESQDAPMLPCHLHLPLWSETEQRGRTGTFEMLLSQQLNSVRRKIPRNLHSSLECILRLSVVIRLNLSITKLHHTFSKIQKIKHSF